MLVVDDNKALAFVIQQMLELQGYDVRTAENGEEGYWVYLLFRPDLVITDIQMPGRDGLELVRRIRVHDSGVRVIYMSGDLSRFRTLLEEEEKRYQVGLLQKPFSKVDLLRLVSDPGFY